MRRLSAIIIFAILTFAAAQYAHAATTYYVSPQGSDSNNGSIENPWRNLAFAVTVARAGDTIILRGGTHIVDEVYIDRRKGLGGAPGQYLTIKAFAGEKPVLEPGSRRLIIWADYVRVEGLHFIMPWRCDAFGEGLQIINNTFTGPQPKFGAIETGGNDILIEGNEIKLEGGGNTQDHGIYVHAGKDIRVRDNTIIGSQGYGIHVFDQHKSTSNEPLILSNYLIEGNFVQGSRLRAGIILAKTENLGPVKLEKITIRGNIIIDNADNGIDVRAGSRIKVYNNTFKNNKFAQLFVDGDDVEIDVKNNIFFQGEAIYKQRGEIAVTTNLYFPELLSNVLDLNSIVRNPEFVDPGSGNFHLRSTSPAIDAGVNIGLPFNGSAPDLGAFEFGGNPTGIVEPGSQPTDFSLQQNYPNPFNPDTQIKYEVPEESYVKIAVYDLTGRVITTLVDGKHFAGVYSIIWDGSDARGHRVASGVYFYKLEVLSNTKSFSDTKRMIMLK